MKRITFVFEPKPSHGRELGQLVEAISQRANVKAGKRADEIEVAVEDAVKVQRILRMHGYSVVDKRIHEAKKNKLQGALELLSEKYEMSDRPVKVTPPPSLHKRKVLDFVNRKAREARRKRSKTRIQYKRDRLDGRIQALDDMLRYLKKKK